MKFPLDFMVFCYLKRRSSINCGFEGFSNALLLKIWTSQFEGLRKELQYHHSFPTFEHDKSTIYGRLPRLKHHIFLRTKITFLVHKISVVLHHCTVEQLFGLVTWIWTHNACKNFYLRNPSKKSLIKFQVVLLIRWKWVIR